MEQSSVHSLTHEEAEITRAAAERFSRGLLSDRELLAEYAEIEESWLLWKGDLEAEDFEDYPRQVIEGAIAYEEARMADITHQMERRMRGRIPMDPRKDAADGDWQSRFDAMRRVSIVEALGTLGLPLVKRGREWTSPCPFHEDRNPSFSVNAHLGLWCCYACGIGGDLVAFVARRQSISRVEAVRYLESVVLG